MRRRCSSSKIMTTTHRPPPTSRSMRDPLESSAPKSPKWLLTANKMIPTSYFFIEETCVATTWIRRGMRHCLTDSDDYDHVESDISQLPLRIAFFYSSPSSTAAFHSSDEVGYIYNGLLYCPRALWGCAGTHVCLGSATRPVRHLWLHFDVHCRIELDAWCWLLASDASA